MSVPKEKKKALSKVFTAADLEAVAEARRQAGEKDNPFNTHEALSRNAYFEKGSDEDNQMFKDYKRTDSADQTDIITFTIQDVRIDERLKKELELKERGNPDLLKNFIQNTLGISEEVMNNVQSAHNQGLLGVLEYFFRFDRFGLITPEGNARADFKFYDFKKDCRLYKEGEDIFFTCHMDGAYFGDAEKKLGYLFLNATMKYKMEQHNGVWGYQLLEIKSETDVVNRALSGEMIDPREVLKERATLIRLCHSISKACYKLHEHSKKKYEADPTAENKAQYELAKKLHATIDDDNIKGVRTRMVNLKKLFDQKDTQAILRSNKDSVAMEICKTLANLLVSFFTLGLAPTLFKSKRAEFNKTVAHKLKIGGIEP